MSLFGRFIGGAFALAVLATSIDTSAAATAPFKIRLYETAVAAQAPHVSCPGCSTWHPTHEQACQNNGAAWAAWYCSYYPQTSWCATPITYEDENHLHCRELHNGVAYGDPYSYETGCPDGYTFVNGECIPSGGLNPQKNLGQPENSCLIGNPVNPATGNKFQVETDYIGNGVFPLQFARYYNSQQATGAAMGMHWRHFYERSLTMQLSPGVPTVGVYRPDGKAFYFNQVNGSWISDADVVGQLSTNGTTWTYTQNDIAETYDTNGRLLALTHRSGMSQVLSYTQGLLTTVTDSFGRSLTLTYSGTRLSGFVDPASKSYAFEYTGGLLTRVVYPDTKDREYHYTDASFPFALTGIVDENDAAFASWTYDAQGRAASSSHADGADSTTLTYNVDGTTTVTDALYTARIYEFDITLGVARVKKVNGPASHCGNAAETAFGGDGFVTQKKDFNGNITTYTHNARGLEESRTEAYGAPVARTITTQWHPTFRVPTQIDEPGRRTVYTYDATTGDRLTQTVTDLATNESRTTTWTYTTFGRVLTVDGPRTDVSDVTTYEYYSCTTGAECGQVHTITNAVGHVTTITSYNAHGNPLAIVDANGVSTVLSYDLRQRLKTRTVGGVMTTFDYDGAGQLDKVTLPGGAFLDYTYDNAHRLTDIQDNAGNRIHYALDAMGNRTAEEVFDSTNALKRKQSQVFNALGRLEEIKNAAGQVVSAFLYDAQGNRTRRTDYSTPTTGHATEFYRDSLNRIWKVKDAANGETEHGLNALDQLTFVKDPKALTTSYIVNAFGNVTKQVSPDTGETNYTYDAAGNRKTRQDARNITATYAYDALNRLTLIDYPYPGDTDVAYRYDGTNYTSSEPYGKGRLTGVTDSVGMTGTKSLFYDARGNLTYEHRSMAFETRYGYDLADRLISMEYPRGRAVTYVRNNIGQVTQVTTTLLGVTTTVADNIAYMPFGGVKGYTLGNGVAVTRQHNDDGRVIGVKDQGASLIQDVTFDYDLRGNVDATADWVANMRSQTFVYDALSRLTSGESQQYGLRAYAYDAVGNRLSEASTLPGGSPVTDTYTYTSSNHKLSAAGGTIFSYDSAGNVTARGSLGLSYDNAGRGVTVGSGRNTYDHSGKRIRKEQGGVTTYFQYDQQGHVIEERVTSVASAMNRYYVWLGDLPLSLEAPSGPTGEIIVDNTDAGFSTTGAWGTSTSAAGYYGADYRSHAGGVTVTIDDRDAGTSKTGTWSNTGTDGQPYLEYYNRSTGFFGGGSFTWATTSLVPGKYRVYAYWPATSGGTGNATFTVTHASGSTQYSANQQINGAQWRLLGTHTFGTNGQVRLSGLLCCLLADAVRFEPVFDDTARWAAPAAQMYEVYARWPASASHTSASVYRVAHAWGSTDVARDQQANGGVWNLLGTYTFSNPATQGVTLLAHQFSTVAADAVRFVPIVTSSQTTTYYYHLDHVGTPQKLTSPSQQVVWDASYEPFGEAAVLTSTVTQPLRFPGQYFDAETGLHQNWHRDYDPSIGRYLQSDPIGLDSGSLNTYAYVDSNPLTATDPEGLAKMYQPKRRLRECTADEYKHCEATCGSRGVQSCKVVQTFRPTQVKGGLIGLTWKDGQMSCSCNEADGFCPPKIDWQKYWWVPLLPLLTPIPDPY
jgi:RHS repeat-associated protein